jgi:hypothetical protein
LILKCKSYEGNKKTENKKRKERQIKKKGGQLPIWAEPEAAAHLPAQTGTPFSFSFPS